MRTSLVSHIPLVWSWRDKKIGIYNNTRDKRGETGGWDISIHFRKMGNCGKQENVSTTDGNSDTEDGWAAKEVALSELLRALGAAGTRGQSKWGWRVRRYEGYCALTRWGCQWGKLLAVCCVTSLHLERDGPGTGIPKPVPFHSTKMMYIDYTRKGNMGYSATTQDFEDFLGETGCKLFH